jgi:hypothetical protein
MCTDGLRSVPSVERSFWTRNRGVKWPIPAPASNFSIELGEGIPGWQRSVPADFVLNDEIVSH